jgi:hypothetical protein
MTINEIVKKVENEKQTPGRFPTRVIFARNWTDYAYLVSSLRKVCDSTLNLADFARGDLIPDFKALKRTLIKNAEKQILLLSFGEYLRLCAKREYDKTTAVFKCIWEPDPVQPSHSVTKYIIPLFGGREPFDNAVHYVDKERQEKFLWELTESCFESECAITVYSPAFADAVNADAVDFGEWLSKWDTLFAGKERKHFSLVTGLYKYAGSALGNVNIEIVDDPFLYVSSLVSDGSLLKREFGDERFWSNVAKHVKTSEPFVATIDHALNSGRTFDPIPVLARFRQLTGIERTLFWMRYKIYGGNDYCSYAIEKTSIPDEIPFALRDAVFKLAKPSMAFLEERLSALYALDLRYDEGYFAKLDTVQPVKSRFSFLSYKTAEECAYAIKTVSGLLRTGADAPAHRAADLAAVLKNGYPALAEYLSPKEAKTDNVSKYFDWYRQSKLINRAPEDIPYCIDLNAIDSRNKIIQNSGDTGYPLWIDGLGVEWLPLLISELNTLAIDVFIDGKAARSILPSETEYNHQWEAGDEKWDRLDTLSHSGLPDDKDYFSCIATQIGHVRAIARRVGELLADHNCVVITGDHGSSRLAALMFHVSGNAIAPPKDAVVRSFGRFCELPDDTDAPISPSMECVTSKRDDGRTVKCLVMKTYEHFTQSGNAAGGNTDDNAVAGEVHGGMTPEECLVPVIVVKRKTLLMSNAPQKAGMPKGISQNDMGI